MKPPIKTKLSRYLTLPLLLISVSGMVGTFANSPGDLPPPDLQDDTDTTNSGQPITLDVLANDITFQGSVLQLNSVDDPGLLDGDGVRTYGSAGTTSVVDNKIVYTPFGDTTGTAEFSYVAEDAAGKTNFATVTVEVTPATPGSPAPTAGDDTASTSPGEVIFINPFWNDTGSNLTITKLQAVYGNNGTMVIEGNQFKYTAGATQTGEDTFYYDIADDMGRTNFATVTVNVASGENPFPTGVTDSYTVDKGSEGNVFAVLDNDIGAGLTVELTSDFSLKGGTVSVDASGQLIYKAPVSADTDNIWYTLKDIDGRTNWGQVDITLTGGAENSPPDAVEDGLRTNVDIDGRGERELDVLANDTDPDGDTLVVTSVGDARFGSVRLDNGQVFYTPPETGLVSDAFPYTVSDGNGGTDITVATISVTVSTNISPTITGENVSVAPGGSIDIDALANDEDPNGDVLTVDEVRGASQGTIEKIGNIIRYTAQPDASGTDQFFYGVFDSQGGNGFGIVTITIE